MSNTPDVASRWTRYLASRAYVPRAHLIQQHFDSGTITRLCECGCQSFDLTLTDTASLEPLMPASGRSGSALELDYHIVGGVEAKDFVELRVSLDARGYLSGVDVEFRGNSAPMPDHVILIEPPFHVHGALAGMTSNKRWKGP